MDLAQFLPVVDQNDVEAPILAQPGNDEPYEQSVAEAKATEASVIRIVSNITNQQERMGLQASFEEFHLVNQIGLDDGDAVATILAESKEDTKAHDFLQASIDLAHSFAAHVHEIAHYHGDGDAFFLPFVGVVRVSAEQKYIDPVDLLATALGTHVDRFTAIRTSAGIQNDIEEAKTAIMVAQDFFEINAIQNDNYDCPLLTAGVECAQHMSNALNDNLTHVKLAAARWDNHPEFLMGVRSHTADDVTLHVLIGLHVSWYG